jgi:hypothetical protein
MFYLRWTILCICWMLESKLFRSIHNHLNHITWFCRNSASISQFATLSHRTWIASDFSSFQFSQKRSKLSDCTFWNFFYKRKISFLLILCMRKRHSSVIENYIRSDDVIWCEFDYLILTEIDSLFKFIVSKVVDRLS